MQFTAISPSPVPPPKPDLSIRLTYEEVQKLYNWMEHVWEYGKGKGSPYRYNHSLREGVIDFLDKYK